MSCVLEMSTFKLYYFNVRGRAEPTRILLAQADVKYEDIRFAGKEDWESKYKNGQPVTYCYVSDK